MSSIRRSKTMPTDGPTAKFLYTIIKQLDLKSIDWNLVASQLDISNGHAARMRFSRFKQQMEGVASTPRSAKPKSAKPHGSSKGNPKADLPKTITPPPPPPIKQETPYDPNQSPYIKADPYGRLIPSLEEIPHEPSQMGPPMTMTTMHPLQSQQRRQQSRQHCPRRHPHQQQQAFPFTSHPSPFPQYPLPPPMTVSPADLNISPNVSPFSPASFSPQMHMGFDMSLPRQPVWTSVKQEGEDGGFGDMLVKMEGGQSNSEDCSL